MEKLPIILIAAMTKDRVIGSGDGMPWDIPEEYQTFIDTIRGQTVIMGRSSYKIFGPDLTCDHTIVLSRSTNLADVTTADSLEEAIQEATSFGKKIFIGGGAQVYQEAMRFAGWMYLSEIREDYSGDKYFPEWKESDWEIALQEEHQRFIYRRWRRVTRQ